MWEKIARFILRSRWMLLILLLALTGLMGYHASKVQMSYEFARAIPTDNPKYQAYQAFRSQFGEDGNLMAIGITTDKLFQAEVFNDYAALAKQIKEVNAVEDVLSVPAGTNLVKDTANEKLNAVPVFPSRPLTQVELDSLANIFYSLPF